MSLRTERYVHRYYYSAPGWKDGTTEFHSLIREHVPRGAKILEVGSGPSNATSRFLAEIGEVHGLDPDPDVKNNDALATAQVLVGDDYPYGDASFDACISDYVCEHVANPARHLGEIARVLRPGGVYLFRTPNLVHYVALFSAMTPHWVHVAIANRLRARQGAHDPYPTHYAMNTRAAVRRHAEGAGLEVVSLRMVEKEPSYGMINGALFFTFMAYERIVNATELLAPLRSNIFGVLRRR